MSKILIFGTSGIGKTTLAKHLSETLDIPFINGSSSVLWDKYTISCHNDLLKMNVINPEIGLRFQYDLLHYRNELLQGLTSYVTDRTIVDNLVHFLFQNAPYLTDKQVEQYIEACIGSFDTQNKNNKWIFLTRDFYIGDEMPKVPSDGKRIENNYFQDVINDIYDRVLERRMLGLQLTQYGNYLKLRNYNWDARIEKVKNLLYV